MQTIRLSYELDTDADKSTQTEFENSLIRMLDAVDSQQSLQKAARYLGVSYRHFWGELLDWEARLGQCLVIREQGKPAKLSPLGKKLLWAERSVLARNALEIERIRTELAAAFAEITNPEATVIRMSGCFDPLLAKLPAFAFPFGFITDLRFSSSLEGLSDFLKGSCDIAVFAVPKDAERGSIAAEVFAPYLDPETTDVCRFAVRTQGLAVARGNPKNLRKLGDVVKRRLRYAGRSPESGTRVLQQTLLKAGGMKPHLLDSPALVESSAQAVAVAVASGRADAGLCLEHAARSFGADFLPMAEEECFLVWKKRAPLTVLDFVRLLLRPEWRDGAADFAGINAKRCGDYIDIRKIFGWW